MAKRVFISFKAEDEKQVRGLRLLNANENFDVDFYDESVRTAIRSENETYVRQKIREKINRTSVTVCLIGKNTHASEWVAWELDESIKKGNKMTAMALKGIDKATLPAPIKERKLTFHAWDAAALGRLVQ